ncbi:RlpA-like double-psi beta-barrel-protein domain-containing protein-containing protein [Mycena sanguinolenta]|nr:RlpA-like double-psi beta-barrel-protein domain-containing protein-containing protein [Mycena sanguinolenta]
MYFTASFLSVIATCLAAGVNANHVTAPETNLSARTTVYHGQAIWYAPNGNVGACGAPIQNSDFAVALSSLHFENGEHCFQHLNVECWCFFTQIIVSELGSNGVSDNGKNIDVTVEDLCPGCGEDDIDLTMGAFAALADLSVGVIPVSWYFK